MGCCLGVGVVHDIVKLVSIKVVVLELGLFMTLSYWFHKGRCLGVGVVHDIVILVFITVVVWESMKF